MWRKFSIFLILFGVAVTQPLTEIAQTPPAAPRPDDWYGPWFMWQWGWSFWWICPLIMMAMMLGCFFMCFGRRHHDLH